MSDPVLHPLLALIKEQNLIDDLQLEEVMQEQARSGKNCSQILVDFEMVDMDTQLELIARGELVRPGADTGDLADHSRFNRADVSVHPGGSIRFDHSGGPR